jgi:hypothetical protein
MRCALASLRMSAESASCDADASRGRASLPVQVGPDVWGFEDDDGGGVAAGLQPDAAFADAWNDSGSTVHPGATSNPNEVATSKAARVSNTAARGGNSSPQGSHSSDTTHALPSGSAGVEDLRFQPVPAQVMVKKLGVDCLKCRFSSGMVMTTSVGNQGKQGPSPCPEGDVLDLQEDADDDDPFGWMMESGAGGGSEAGAGAGGGGAAPVSTAGAAYGAAATSSSSTPKHKAYNPISAGAY